MIRIKPSVWYEQAVIYWNYDISISVELILAKPLNIGLVLFIIVYRSW